MDTEFFFDTHGDSQATGSAATPSGHMGHPGPSSNTPHNQNQQHQHDEGNFDIGVDIGHLNMNIDMNSLNSLNSMNVPMNMNMNMNNMNIPMNMNMPMNNAHMHMPILDMPLNMNAVNPGLGMNMNMNMNGVNMLDMGMGMGMDMDLHPTSAPHEMNMGGQMPINMAGLDSSYNNHDSVGMANSHSYSNEQATPSQTPISASTSVPLFSTALVHSYSNPDHPQVPLPISANSSSVPDFGETGTNNASISKKQSPRRHAEKRRSSLQLDDVPSSSSLLSSSASAAAIASANQQKRTRASGEILDYLVAEFSKNSNPTTQMRKEISSRTGMPERSVRIWFQNRRAKARKLEKLNQSAGAGNSSGNANTNFNANTNGNEINADAMINSSNPSTPHNIMNNVNNPISSSGSMMGNMSTNANSLFQQSDMKIALSRMNTAPVEINGKYYLIECKSLSVGNWQRIKSGYLKSDTLNTLTNLSPKLLGEIMSTTDLLVILSKKDQELNYFFSGVFQNEKVLFRIFYPILNILKCSLLNQTQHIFFFMIRRTP